MESTIGAAGIVRSFVSSPIMSELEDAIEVVQKRVNRGDGTGPNLRADRVILAELEQRSVLGPVDDKLREAVTYLDDNTPELSVCRNTHEMATRRALLELERLWAAQIPYGEFADIIERIKKTEAIIEIEAESQIELVRLDRENEQVEADRDEWRAVAYEWKAVVVALGTALKKSNTKYDALKKENEALRRRDG